MAIDAQIALTMARRKRRFLEDEDDSSDVSEDEEMEGGYQGEDPDVREERQLFESLI